MTTPTQTQPPLGAVLAEQIGVPWILTITSDPEFLKNTGLSSGMAWALLWRPMDSSEAQEAQSAILWYKGFLETQGAKPLQYPQNLVDIIRFTPGQAPPHLMTDQELAHVALREAAAKGVFSQTGAQNLPVVGQGEQGGIGPGGIIIGGALAVIAIVALYKWMTRIKEEED